MPANPRDVIVPLDFPTKSEAMRYLDLFDAEGERPFVKIGMELFYAEGLSIVRETAARGLKIFLDIKVCDIPNTAKGAMASLAGLPIDIVNCHALGGLEMMRWAREGLESRGGSPPLLVGVTVLTSISEAMLNAELGIPDTVNNTALRLARLAKAAGLGGVVCAPGEAGLVHQACGDDFITITPGVRFPDADTIDQQRAASPIDARRFGSDYIVVGRPISKAANPVQAYRRYRNAFLGIGENIL
ncbi:MAG: orotidine-5'-phosphate decarboxylase [Oscillospiraceae bacterium]|jgi:orotidine-5'-phosphate decarboxylase|nr:orotidine-5'-phosphate decarboxylase [Oscillospiraceae bacterium]